MISMIALSTLLKRGEGNCSYRGDFNGHIGTNPENYKDQYGGYCYGLQGRGKDS